MLSYEQLAHFADHGWVVLPDVLDQSLCAAYIAAMDRCVRTRRTIEVSHAVDTKQIDNQVLYDDIFLDWFKLPGVLDANRQLIGAPLRLNTSFAHIRIPHPDRATRGDQLTNIDNLGWHRDWRPKWGIVPHDADPRLIHCTMTNNVTYLTAVSAGNGSTAVLDGSHTLEGSYQTLKDRCPVLQPSLSTGSILLFSETLIHAAVPILSERIRYNMYYNFTPAWIAPWNNREIPYAVSRSIVDDEIRDVLSPPTMEDEKGVLPRRVHFAAEHGPITASR
jgi:ectoine hydroxylase-related dioxygenase (phytanoyl-CoA dioxygenase family)